jgi:NAD-dependent deacetylase
VGSVAAAGLGRAAALLRGTRHAVALSGAGISTPSGLPDFRSTGEGLWEHVDPMEVASLLAVRQQPEAFYAFARPFARRLLSARPNPAHLALARLELAGRLHGVITQNVDGLHQMAGSRAVLEVHGNLRRATCLRCYRSYPSEEALRGFVEDGTVPRCPACGGVLKPDAILMGEQLPRQVHDQALTWARSCDLMLVVGSSLEVMPAALLPLEAVQSGGRLILVNRQPTYLDPRADVVLRDDVAEVLPRLASEVLNGP